MFTNVLLAFPEASTHTLGPVGPGTIAGQYDPDRYHFVNFDYEDVLADMRAAMELIRKHSRSKCLRFLFTVSPVPLTATYSGDHVTVATTYSKSVLRAVVGKLAAVSSPT